MENKNITDTWHTSHSAMEVQAAKNYLESEDIPAFVQNELAAQMYGSVADKPKILVKENDFDKAKEVLIRGGYLKK